MTSLLVLGGTSWVGGAIAADATRRGLEVTCLARGESGRAPAGVSFVRADRAAEDAYDEVVDRHWDLVVDVSRQPGHVRGAVESLADQVGHWSFVSTSSVYADQSGPLAEDAALLPALTTAEGGPEAYGEGKVACEQWVATVPRHLIVRAGLIGGPGDRSDRLGHYVARFALAAGEPVLVPGVADQPAQVIDVRDLATWVLDAALHGETGIVNAPGQPVTIGAILDASAAAAGSDGRVTADSDWLREHGVQEWMGPRSLPLWLPASHHGMGLIEDSRAVAMGLRRRPLAGTLRDVLSDERARGLERPRRAGIGRTDELELIDHWLMDETVSCS